MNIENYPISKIFFNLVFLVLVSGCGGGSLVSEGIDVSPPNFNRGDVALDTRVGVVPPQKLTPGKCGFYLWSKTRAPKLIFVRNSPKDPGLMFFDQKELILPLAGSEGELFLGFALNQFYQTENYFISLKIPEKGVGWMDEGLKVDRGVLTIRQKDGWEFLTPVAGMVACSK